MIFEISSNNTKCVIVSLYRSPSQSTEEFDDFLSKFESILKLLCRHHLTLILGDFNARSSSWWSNDINSFEGMRIEALTDFYGFNQLISEPTHILPQSSSCIDLIFTNQLNMIFKSEVHPTLFPTCHHQIISVEISLKVNFHFTIENYGFTRKLIM